MWSFLSLLPAFSSIRAAVLRFSALMERENILSAFLCRIRNTLQSKDVEQKEYDSVLLGVGRNVHLQSPAQAFDGAKLALPLGCVLSHR